MIEAFAGVCTYPIVPAPIVATSLSHRLDNSAHLNRFALGGGTITVRTRKVHFTGNEPTSKQGGMSACWTEKRYTFPYLRFKVVIFSPVELHRKQNLSVFRETL